MMIKINYLIAQINHVVYVLQGQYVMVAHRIFAKGGKQKIVMEVVLSPLLVLHIKYIGTQAAETVLKGLHVMGQKMLNAMKHLVFFLIVRIQGHVLESIVVGLGAFPLQVPSVLLVHLMQIVMVLKIGRVSLDILNKILVASPLPRIRPVTKHQANRGITALNVQNVRARLHAMVVMNSYAELVHINVQAQIVVARVLEIITRKRVQKNWQTVKMPIPVKRELTMMVNIKYVDSAPQVNLIHQVAISEKVNALHK